MKATIYLRVSTQRQAQTGVSLRDGDDPGVQESKCRELCQLRGWDVASVESDPISGRKRDNRPGLKRAMKQAKATGGVLVVYSLSRLSRSARDMHNICGELETAGVNLASATEAVDTTTAMGRAFFGLLAIFAQLESDQTSERVRAVRQHALKKHGYHKAGRQPYGWTLDENGTRVEVAEQQAAIKRMRTWRKKLTERQVVALLNSQSIPAPYGGVWHIGAVTRVLKTAKRVKARAPKTVKADG